MTDYEAVTADIGMKEDSIQTVAAEEGLVLNNKRKRKLERMTPAQRSLHDLQKEIINCYKEMNLPAALQLYQQGRDLQLPLFGADLMNSLISLAAGLV